MSAKADTVIRFDPDGSGVCLWTEALPLAELGQLQISRASTIEFNNLSGMWEVSINGEVLCISRSRQFCLDWEHNYINNRIAEGKR